MRAFTLLLCVCGLTGCGLAKRFIPRPTPRVIITGGHIISMNAGPCALDDADADVLLAAYYGGALPPRLPS